MREVDGSPEDRLIAQYFRPLAKHPGAFGLADDAAAITPPAPRSRSYASSAAWRRVKGYGP